MTKHTTAVLLLCTALSLLLSACTHGQKKDEQARFFSFMGNEMQCKETTTNPEPETDAASEVRSYSCSNKKMEASFFYDAKEEGWLLDAADEIIDGAVEDLCEGRRESIKIPCWEGTGPFVFFVKCYGKETTKTPSEVIFYANSDLLMFVQPKKIKKGDASILTNKAITNLCNRYYWFDPIL